MTSRPEAIAASSAFGCVGMTAGYALVRLLGRTTHDGASPSSVLWMEHSAMLWSLLNALWLAGMVAFGGYLLVRSSPERAPQWLVRGVMLATAAIVLQGLLWP